MGVKNGKKRLQNYNIIKKKKEVKFLKKLKNAQIIYYTVFEGKKMIQYLVQFKKKTFLLFHKENKTPHKK